MSMYALIGAIETGLVFGLVALGTYITFRVLDFPDLTVEGSFPFGAAVCATLMSNGIPAWWATAAAIVAGAIAGLVTATLNLKFRIMRILAGILTAIALYSINLRTMGRPNIGLIGIDTVYSTVERMGVRSAYVSIVLLGAVVIVSKLALDFFLNTGFGLSMRAAGANPRMARANGINVEFMIYLGLSIANALTALSGALFAQMLGAADVSMGIGVIAVALAAVIGGTALIPSRILVVTTLACVLGSILYRLVLALALNTNSLGLTASDVNLVTAVLVAIALYVPNRKPNLTKL